MDMKEAIKGFPAQFAYEPQIENEAARERREKFAVVGMGGSHLTAGLIAVWKPELDLVIHRDYGLPILSDLKDRLIILSSYSGNTEEVIEGFHRGRKEGLAMCAIATGGELLALAREACIPYIAMPKIGIQPRSATGFGVKALLAVMDEQEASREIAALCHTLSSEQYEAEGKKLAQELRDCVPVIYASTRNGPIAYTWKITFNETGKIPAFSNVFPEMNHNEMTGFDVFPRTQRLSERFSFIFLTDDKDDERVKHRMKIVQEFYAQRGLPVRRIPITGASAWIKIFSSLLLADWAAYYTAEAYGVEVNEVPMVELLKERLREKRGIQ